MAEQIQKTDTLNQGREKLNEAIKDAVKARIDAGSAVSTSNQAKQIAQTAEHKADSVQAQFDQVIIEGDSSVEAAAARVGTDNVSYPTLKARLDAENTKVTAQLADTEQNVKDIRYFNVTRPAFCFVDDDGKKEVMTILKPLFDSKGIKGTSAVITGRLGESRYMTVQEVMQLHNEGWEIQPHSVTHPDLTTVSSTQLRNELKGSQDYLRALGIKADHFFYPYGRFNQTVINETKKYYKSACRTAHGDNVRPIKTYEIFRVGIGVYGPTPVQLETYKRYIDYAIENNLLCVLTTHIEETPTENIHLIGDVIDYVHSRGYQFDTYSDAYEKHKNVMEIGNFNFAVGAAGEVESKTIRNIVADYDAFNSSNAPSDFKPFSITTNVVRSNNSEGLPESRGGTLTTYRLSNDADFTYQEFRGRGGVRYSRNQSGDSWTDWERLDTYIILDSNSVTNSDPASRYPRRKVSVVHIADNMSNGFPENTGGVLKTYRITGDDSSTYQEYKLRTSNRRYTRRWNNNSWIAWRPVDFHTFIEPDTYTANTPATDYPERRITTTYIRNANANGFPENKGGTLTMYRLSTDDAFTYQEYKIINNNNTYIRTWTSGAWGSWEQK